MTIIGPDRTGLVESVARVVAGHGGNWLESRMCRLGGEFAGILRIELPAEKRQALIDALQALQGSGLSVVVRPGEVTPPRCRAGRPNSKSSDTIARALSAKSPARSHARA